MIKESMAIIESTSCDRLTIKDNSDESNIAEQNGLFLSAIEKSCDAIVITRVDGIITYVNAASLNMFGYSKDQALGKQALEFLSIQDQQRALRLTSKSLETGQGYLSHFKAVRKGGTNISIEITASAIKDQKEQTLGFIYIIRSLDERIKNAQLSMENKNLYENLFANMLDGFAYCKMLFSSEGTPEDFLFLEINDAFECITGVVRSDVLGKKVTEVIPELKHDSPELLVVFGKVALTGESERFEIFLKSARIWLDITIYSPKKEYFAIVFENVTARKEMEEKLEKYSEGLELTIKDQIQKLKEAQETVLKNERLAAIGQLSGMVGHDLRNPLCGIKNASYFIRKKQPNLIESSVQMLNVIDNAVDYSNKIVNDLLDFGRELHLEFEECSTKSLLDYVLLSIKIPNNIKIIDHVEGTSLIWVDSNKIERVFSNIIKNAIEAMVHGGTLEITSQRREESIEFIFTDTGEGMTEETLAKIFTPLFTMKAKGMGFGLAICKRIIEAHKGSITVSSIRGKGTSFTIKLPIEHSENFEN